MPIPVKICVCIVLSVCLFFQLTQRERERIAEQIGQTCFDDSFSHSVNRVFCIAQIVTGIRSKGAVAYSWWQLSPGSKLNIFIVALLSPQSREEWKRNGDILQVVSFLILPLYRVVCLNKFVPSMTSMPRIRSLPLWLKNISRVTPHNSTGFIAWW